MIVVFSFFNTIPIDLEAKWKQSMSFPQQIFTLFENKAAFLRFSGNLIKDT